VCTHAPTSGGRGYRRRRRLRLQRAAFRQAHEKVQLCAFDVLALDGDDYLDALPRLRPYRTDRVRRTRSAANGEGALFFFRYGQADAEKRSRACLAPNLGFIRIAPACDSAIMPGLMAMKGGHQMPYKICATVHPDCRLPTRSSMADITVTCIEGEQHGDALVADGSALRR
jgi:hypothetical protein